MTTNEPTVRYEAHSRRGVWGVYRIETTAAGGRVRLHSDDFTNKAAAAKAATDLNTKEN